MLDRADSIKPVPIDWLWPRYIARGKLTSFAGLQAQGKSPVTRDIRRQSVEGLSSQKMVKKWLFVEPE